MLDNPYNSGTYDKGKKTVDRILSAATAVLIDNGYHNFSLRRVADKAGVKLSNLQYYFSSKGSLVQAMLNEEIQGYLDLFEEIRSRGKPRDQLVEIITTVMTDLGERKTTVFFPELWSLANHDANVDIFMEEMYSKYRDVLNAIILDINPELTKKQARRLSLFISSSMEGHTVFVGYKKPWNSELKNIIKISIQSFLWLIEKGDIPK